MSKDITVTIDGSEYTYPRGTRYEDIAGEWQKKYKDRIALVLIDEKIQELFHTLKRDCTMSFITLRDPIGHATYQRTAVMMLLKALYDTCGKENIERAKIQFAIGRGLYCTVKGNVKVDDTLAQRLSIRMKNLVDEDIPISKKTYPIEEAVELFEKAGFSDKVKLFRYRRSSSINVYSIGDYFDYFYGYMLPSTGYVKYFDILTYEGGLMLLLPDKDSSEKIDFFEPREKLFSTLMQSSNWGETLRLDTVGELNNRICDGDISEIILVQESLQEIRIGEIARDIKERGNVKFVMIAGPSSSGKTTFSHRLSIQLKSLGLNPYPIALDDYFVNRVNTPRDENGEYDFECLEAIDVQGFNEDMSQLLEGKEVTLPRFNFITGEREYKGKTIKLNEGDILVIEGIHGLNGKTSYALPDESKYKIYISALTSLNVDDHNRIATNDGRLLRRLVRDARTRGADARRTISMWPSVRRGEERNIFPFQEKVDATFNSVLVYEIAVLKQYAEPLLFNVKKDEPEYYEARRLLKFLEYFLGVSSEEVPANSIVREFIGGSYFDV